MQEREHDFSTFQDIDLKRETQREKEGEMKNAFCTKAEDVHFKTQNQYTEDDGRKKYGIFFNFIYISPTSSACV